MSHHYHLTRTVTAAVLICATLLSVCLFTACGAQPDDGKKDPPTQTDKPDVPDTPEEETGPSAAEQDAAPVPSDINTGKTTPVKRIDIGTTEIGAYRIIISADADNNTVQAANELAANLKKAGGYELTVARDTEPQATHEILVGRTNRDTAETDARRATLENDGIMMYVTENGKKLYLESCSSLGVTYAVYRFLKERIGCDLYWQNWEGWNEGDETCYGVREADYVRVPATLDYTHSSPLYYRYTDWTHDAEMQEWHGMNGWTDPAYQIVDSAHSMSVLAEIDITEQPCLTDEATYQTILKNLRQHIQNNPTSKLFAVTQNDNLNFCQCDNCRALIEAEGYSGAFLSMVNRLADEIAVDYPDVYLVTFAYFLTRTVPTTIVPRDNVVIWMVTNGCCYAHTLDDPDCEENRAFAADMEAWGKIAKHMLFWDYTTDYIRYYSPFPDLMVMYDNVQFMVQNNAYGIFEEGNSQCSDNGEFAHLRAYLIGELLWNPYMTRDEYLQCMQDFLNGYYGAGGPYIYEYILATSEKVTEHHMGIYYDQYDEGPLYRKEDGTIDKTFIRKMDKLWEKAVTATEDDLEAQQRVLYSKCQQDYLSLIANWTGSAEDVEKNKDLVRRLKDCGLKWYMETNYVQGPIDDLFQWTNRNPIFWGH